MEKYGKTKNILKTKNKKKIKTYWKEKQQQQQQKDGRGRVKGHQGNVGSIWFY